MSDITEALGTAAEGGLLAKAVSNDGTPVEKGHFAEGSCLNCGTVLTGRHCHECGQKAHLHRTIGAFFHDLLHGALHLDGKIWRTLPLLIRKPGELTRRYVEGERTSFVSPMALFLFSVFLMFAVFQMIGFSVPNDLPEANTEQLERALDGQVERVDGEIKDLDEQLEQEGLSAAEQAELEIRRQQLIDQQEGLMMAGELPVFGASESEDGNGIVPLATEEQDGYNMNLTGIEQFDAELFKKWRENPSLMLYKLQANAYKFSWLLIPLSIPFVWLLFAWKRRFKAYDHAIFVTYSITFVSLLFIALSLLTVAGIGDGWLYFALAVLPPLHLYKHLKYAYDLSRFGAIWRLFVLHIFILIILSLFFQVLLLLGAF